MIEGIGLGLRHALAKELFASAESGEPSATAVSWLELHPENYLARGGRYQSMLASAEARWPLLTHGVSMGFGSLTPYDRTYVRALRGLLERLRAPFHSDHLCFASVDGVFLHDLLPLPLQRESIDVAVDRIKEAQDGLSLPIAVEHISFYALPPGSHMREVDHLSEILVRADAKLLLDVNNVYVNACNHGFDAREFIDQLPLERVVQLHVAGHYLRDDGLRIDTHGEAVCEEVFALFEYTMGKLARPLPVLLERDDNIPPLTELLAEVARLRTIYERVLGPAPQARALP